MMRKQKEYFEFRCPYSSDVLFGQLERQVKSLTDREYLLEQTAAGFDLGIARGGHQGGYWYCASVSEDNGGSYISGRIVYRTWDGEEILENWRLKLEYYVFIVLLAPVILPIWIYRLFKAEVTDEERFAEFMITRMDCELMK